MKEIKTINGTILAINVPEEISKFWIHFESISGETRVAQDTNGLTTWDLCLEKGLHLDKYKILGKLSELSEEECKKFIVFDDWSDDYEPHKYKGCFSNYLNFDENEEVINYDEKVGFDAAKESLISLLQSQGVDTKNENTLLLIRKL